MFRKIVSKIISFVLGEKNKVSKRTEEKISQKWHDSINSALKSNSPSQLKQAMIVADKLLDTALEDIVKGESLGVKLKLAKPLFTDETYDLLWKAHKVRNSIAHDVDYEPTYFVLREAIESIKKGFYELGINLEGKIS